MDTINCLIGGGLPQAVCLADAFHGNAQFFTCAIVVDGGLAHRIGTKWAGVQDLEAMLVVFVLFDRRGSRGRTGPRMGGTSAGRTRGRATQSGRTGSSARSTGRGRIGLVIVPSAGAVVDLVLAADNDLCAESALALVDECLELGRHPVHLARDLHIGVVELVSRSRARCRLIGLGSRCGAGRVACGIVYTSIVGRAGAGTEGRGWALVADKDSRDRPSSAGPLGMLALSRGDTAGNGSLRLLAGANRKIRGTAQRLRLHFGALGVWRGWWQAVERGLGVGSQIVLATVPPPKKSAK